MVKKYRSLQETLENLQNGIDIIPSLQTVTRMLKELRKDIRWDKKPKLSYHLIREDLRKNLIILNKVLKQLIKDKLKKLH